MHVSMELFKAPHLQVLPLLQHQRNNYTCNHPCNNAPAMPLP